jgi:ATP-binding cassette subfamily B protein
MKGKIPARRIAALWPYARQWQLRIGLALAGLTIVSLTSLVYPWLLKLMVDRLSGRMDSPFDMTMLFFLLLLLFVIASVVGYYQQKEMKMLGLRLRNTLRIALYERLLARPMVTLRQIQVGEISSRATEDIGRLQTMFSNLLAPAFQNVLFIGGCLFLMASLSRPATLSVLCLVFILIPLIYVLGKKIRHQSSLSQADHAHANAFFEESLVAIREIKAFGREKLEVRRYSSLLTHALENETVASTMQVRVNQIIYALFSGALLLIFFAGMSGMMFPVWSTGDVVAFYFYSYTMTMATLSLGRISLSYQEFAGALERVVELLEDGRQHEPAPDTPHASTVTGRVVFEGIVFSYDSQKPVLNNLSLVVNAGEWYLITGPSGSGKSTLAGLLMGFSRPQRGMITIDNIPLAEWHPGTLRRQIGYVGQDPMLVHGTLRENICFHDAPVTDEQLHHAITLSCLDELLHSGTVGLDTVVGERGYTLSAGQKARVAIARAILHAPSILILDEANAGLEPELEKRLWRNLAGSRGDKTTIILSHHVEHIPEIYRAGELRNGLLHPKQPHADSLLAPRTS